MIPMQPNVPSNMFFPFGQNKIEALEITICSWPLGYSGIARAGLESANAPAQDRKNALQKSSCPVPRQFPIRWR